jgi:DNA polymerase III epsilon subunit family exonuclease
MLTCKLDTFRERARRHLLDRDAPCDPTEVARVLFGARFHEDPVASLLVRQLLDPVPELHRAPDGRWVSLEAPFLNVPLAEARLVAVDLESTGSLVGVDDIIEVGVAVLEGGQVVQQFSSLIHSTRHMSGRIRRLTGIRPSQLTDAPDFAEVAPVIMNLLNKSHAFVAHDVRFDLHFLRWELGQHGYDMPELPGICTLQIAQAIWPDRTGWRLQELADDLNVAHDTPHRAGEDACATAGILARSLEILTAHGLRTLCDLYRLGSLLGTDENSARHAG